VKLSVVTTLYYSERYLQEFYTRVHDGLVKISNDYEIIFVNDGSPDNASAAVLELQRHDPKVVLVDLSRNFGHHQAIFTGLQNAQGDYVFLIDCDLEEDPELLHTFWQKMQDDPGIDVVYGVQSKRKGGMFERTSGALFYKILNGLSDFEYPSNTLTARLMNKKYVNAVTSFTERTLDVWAIFVLAGFNQVSVTVQKKSKGSTTYTFAKKVKRSLEIITSISHRPLYVIFFIGSAWSLISAVGLLVILVKKWMYGVDIEGWASIMASLWLIGGIITFLLGVIGIYLSKMFLEIKGRPITIIKTIYKRK
jgi:putative glycosyltransferase